MTSSPLRRATRAVTSPVRGYVNNHFEMVKEEVRAAGGPTQVDDSAAWERVAELENSIAELALYQTRVLNRVVDDVSALSDQVGELERTVRQLAAVVGASYDRT